MSLSFRSVQPNPNFSGLKQDLITSLISITLGAGVTAVALTNNPIKDIFERQIHNNNEVKIGETPEDGLLSDAASLLVINHMKKTNQLYGYTNKYVATGKIEITKDGQLLYTLTTDKNQEDNIVKVSNHIRNTVFNITDVTNK